MRTSLPFVLKAGEVRYFCMNISGFFHHGYDIALVQKLLQHSSPAVTKRYIGLEPQKVENAILGHMNLL